MKGWKRLPFILALTGIVALSSHFAGCSQRPNKNELTRLEEVRMAAENAQKKLAELRQERMRLEEELSRKEQELNNNQKAVEALKKD